MKHFTLTLLAIVILITGCGGSVITTMDNPYEDGDIDSEGTEDEPTEDSEPNPESEGDMENAEDDGEATEDASENEESAEEGCLPHTDASCEDLQGTCPENQVCYPGDINYCYTQQGQVPSDNPNGITAPDGYGPMIGMDHSSMTERWFERCTNDMRECDPEEDVCCHGLGFWASEGAPSFNGGTSHVREVCNADHEIEIIVKTGHCYIESDEDENGDTFMIGTYNEWPNPNDPCTYCNSDENPYEWSLRPVGTTCMELGECTETGECIVPAD